MSLYMGDNDPSREILLNEPVTLAALAGLIDAPCTSLIRVGFEELGQMMTVYDRLSFDEVARLVVHFGYTARRGRDYSDGPP